MFTDLKEGIHEWRHTEKLDNVYSSCKLNSIQEYYIKSTLVHTRNVNCT